MVRIFAVFCGISYSLFIDYTACQDEITTVDYSCKFLGETIFCITVRENSEGTLFFANVVFMEDNLIMAKVFKLKLLKSLHNLFGIVALMENTECQDKHWIIIIDG